MEDYTNDLINETSPYLLQHAHNPVNWVAWSDDAFERAKKENKLVLISVGYSACHWCHVMEHESFEDKEVAALMNKFFISVKVDREERPDVDQVYMTAVQLMTQQGGWPLNCFCLPDGRPIYGGTYFPKDQWIHILKSLHFTFQNDFEKVEEYASKLHEGVQRAELIQKNETEIQFNIEKLRELVLRWSKLFDGINGGDSKAPKFPLPQNYLFLLEYATQMDDQKVMEHVCLSLDKMAMGGIYDQVGGGFARYSVDMLWKVPHFEKMLYDNGQLIELYSKAYRITNSPLYKRVVDETVQWLEREMIADRGGLYSALDADTEGQEGKFYVWSERELAETLTNDFDWASDYFEMGYLSDWEGNKVLMCSQTDEIFLNEKGWTEVFFDQELKKLKKRLLNIRSERVFPGIDDKVLTGWNAMTVKGLAHAAVIFDEPRYLDLGRDIITTLLNNQWDGNQLKRNFKNGYSTIDAFLEDYAHMIDGLIALHQADLEENWINAAVSLTEKAIQEFSDEKSGMFFFTDSSSNLIARKMEINDNVIPSSNSVMAHNLFALGSLTGRMEWINRAEQMMYNVYDGMEMYGSGYSNWAMLLQRMITGQKEVVFAGNNVDEAISEFRGQIDIPVLLARVTESSTLSISQGRHSTDDLIIYVCEKGVCSLPVKSVAEAISRVIQ
ncbi:MAG: thioredoxin domain-containing protein [Crocinitomicaceae bacterium]